MSKQIKKVYVERFLLWLLCVGIFIWPGIGLIKLWQIGSDSLSFIWRFFSFAGMLTYIMLLVIVPILLSLYLIEEED